MTVLAGAMVVGAALPAQAMGWFLISHHSSQGECVAVKTARIVANAAAGRVENLRCTAVGGGRYDLQIEH